MTPDYTHHYRQTLQYLQYEGRKKYGISFKFIKEDIPLILQLICYFTNDKVNAKEHNIDLQKGIMLSGPIGCGKTTLLELIKTIAVPEKKYFFTTAREVSFEFIQDGYVVIQRYSKGIPGQYTRKNFAFDDLGTEREEYYGNRVRSRLREMCNLIFFDNEAVDKR